MPVQYIFSYIVNGLNADVHPIGRQRLSRHMGPRRRSTRAIKGMRDESKLTTENSNSIERAEKRPGRPPGSGRGRGRPRRSTSSVPLQSQEYYYFDNATRSSPMVTEEVVETLVGRRIACFWKDEGEFYFGTICSFDGVKGKAFCHFDDGDEVVLDLKNETWVLVDVPGQMVEHEGELVEQPPLETEMDSVMETKECVVFPTSSGDYGFEIFMNRSDESRLEKPRVCCTTNGYVRVEERVGDQEPRVTEIRLPQQIQPESAICICSDSNQVYIRVSILSS